MNQFIPIQGHDWQRPTYEPDPFHLANQRREVLDADNAYRRMARRGRWHRLWAKLRRQPHGLWSLSAMSKQWSVRTRHAAGLRLVPLKAIRGSEGREYDFDGLFHPLSPERTRQRWLSVAQVRNKGQSLPPVELIQVDDGCSAVYFVRDGHHRISVARSYGQQVIEANVTVWELHGLAPWSNCQPAVQPAAASLTI